jgi:hypothetical protein
MGKTFVQVLLSKQGQVPCKIFFFFCLKQDERPTRPFFHPQRGGPGGGRGGGPGFPRFGRGGGGGVQQQQHLRPFAPFGGIGLPGHPGLDLSKVIIFFRPLETHSF